MSQSNNRLESALLAWLSRPAPAAALIFTIWALLYLPCLGSLELQGEEGRRIFPAMAMIESGDWIAPRVGGEFYLKKPPLANWLIAAAVQATGALNEWTVRLPSALSVLALALGLWVCLRRVLTPTVAFLASAFVLTNIGLLEKGRLAEIDALYIMFFGLAWGWWVAWTAHGKPPSWRAWLPAGMCLGLGVMTKGPLPLLLFFYAFVVTELWAAGRLRSLLAWSHLGGLILAVVPFVAWSLAQSAQVGAERVTGVWAAELMARATPERFSALRWLEGLLRGVTNFLPWAALLPLLWWKPLLAGLPENDRRHFIATRLALTCSYFGVALLPDFRPRYAMPLLVPASVLLAQVLAGGPPVTALQVWRWTVRALALVCGLAALVGPFALASSSGSWGLALAIAAGATSVWRYADRCRDAFSLSLATMGMVVLLTGLFFALGVPVLLEKRSTERATARALARFLPPTESLFAVRSESQRVLFHLGWQVKYLGNLRELPPRRPLCVLVREEPDKAEIANTSNAVKLTSFVGYQKQTLEMWRLGAPAEAR